MFGLAVCSTWNEAWQLVVSLIHPTAALALVWPSWFAANRHLAFLDATGLNPLNHYMPVSLAHHLLSFLCGHIMRVTCFHLHSPFFTHLHLQCNPCVCVCAFTLAYFVSPCQCWRVVAFQRRSRPASGHWAYGFSRFSLRSQFNLHLDHHTVYPVDPHN